jgi:hypothetical protein
LIAELKEKLATLESSIPPGATSEVKESGSKEGDSRGEKHVTFAPENSEGDQTESLSDVSDSTHSVETGGEKGPDGKTISPASTDSVPTSGGPSSAEVVSLNGSAGGEHAPEVSDRTGGEESVGSEAGDKELMQQLTQLVQTQTAMVAAQIRAMSVQNLPPMKDYSGEGIQSSEEGFDRWIEQFEERAKLIGWSEDLKQCN